MKKYLPEHGLGYAVIRQAILDYIDPTVKSCYRRTAETFLFSEAYDHEEMSLVFWCDHLDVDPRRIRRIAIELQGKKLSTYTAKKYRAVRWLTQVIEDPYPTYEIRVA